MRPMMSDPPSLWLPWMSIIAAVAFIIAIVAWGPWFVP
jgi:hypothetical protein